MVAGSEVIGNLPCRDSGLGLPHAREDGNVNVALTDLSDNSFRPLLHFPISLALSSPLRKLYYGLLLMQHVIPASCLHLSYELKGDFVKNSSPPELLCRQFRQAS